MSKGRTHDGPIFCLLLVCFEIGYHVPQDSLELRVKVRMN